MVKTPVLQYYQELCLMGHPEHPTAEKSHSEHPTAEKSHFEHPAVEKTHPEHPIAEKSHPEHPTTEKTHPKHPTAEKTHPKHPAVEKSHPEHPTAEKGLWSETVAPAGWPASTLEGTPQDQKAAHLCFLSVLGPRVCSQAVGGVILRAPRAHLCELEVSLHSKFWINRSTRRDPVSKAINKREVRDNYLTEPLCQKRTDPQVPGHIR